MGAPSLAEPHYGIGFGGAIKRGFIKYATFQGLASRSEYWWWQLFASLLGLGWYLVVYLALSVSEPETNLLVLLLVLGGAGYLILFLPSIALVVRRLHDTGRSGWTYFVSLIPFVGSFILLAFLLSPTSPRAALYGPPSAEPFSPMPLAPAPPVSAPLAPTPISSTATPSWQSGATYDSYTDDTVSASWLADQRGATSGQWTGGSPPSQPPRPGRTGPRISTVLAVAAVVLAIVCVGGTVRYLLLERWADGSGSTTTEVGSNASEETEAAVPEDSPDVEGPGVNTDPEVDSAPTHDAGPTQNPSQPPPVVGKKPAQATSCPSAYNISATPSRSAVNAKTTTCEFAEEVRRAYIESGAQGQPITLNNVYSPRTHQYYVMECTGSTTVTCTGGIKAKVYLY